MHCCSCLPTTALAFAGVELTVMSDIRFVLFPNSFAIQHVYGRKTNAQLFLWDMIRLLKLFFKNGLILSESRCWMDNNAFSKSHTATSVVSLTLN